nr:hypothetical protein [Tanacetum cinerariifolium]GFB02425.1 hypothetical protein [Tanacetum cinerariifolium]
MIRLYYCLITHQSLFFVCCDRIMPPKAMSQAAIERLITQRVNAALEAERAGRVNEGGGSNTNETGGQDKAPLVRECTFSSFMKRNPTPFHGKEGTIELCRWFEKSEMVEYKGHKPLCNNYKKHHNGNCRETCYNYGRPGHLAKDCRRKSTLVCYGCGERGHTRNYCLKKKNPQGEEAQG